MATGKALIWNSRVSANIAVRGSMPMARRREHVGHLVQKFLKKFRPHGMYGRSPTPQPVAAAHRPHTAAGPYSSRPTKFIGRTLTSL